MDHKQIEKLVCEIVKSNINRRGRMKALGFSEKQIRHMEKVALDALAEKEISTKVQAILDETNEGF